MTDEQREQMNTDVKAAMELITDDADILASVNAKILAVVGYLQNGGASDAGILSPLGVACVALGVNDLMERKAGAITFSPAFSTIAMQIARG